MVGHGINTICAIFMIVTGLHLRINLPHHVIFTLWSVSFQSHSNYNMKRNHLPKA